MNAWITAFIVAAGIVAAGIGSTVTVYGETGMHHPAGTEAQNGGNSTAAHSIIESKCTRCHSSKRIDAALSSEKDMFRIQQEMEKKGVILNASERDVLGIYWKDQHPLKKGK